MKHILVCTFLLPILFLSGTASASSLLRVACGSEAYDALNDGDPSLAEIYVEVELRDTTGRTFKRTGPRAGLVGCAINRRNSTNKPKET